jgi:hypothetical protein
LILSPKQYWVIVQIMKLVIIEFSSLPCYLVPLRSKYSPQHPILKHAEPAFLSRCQWPSFTPIKTTCKILILCILIWFKSVTLNYVFNIKILVIIYCYRAWGGVVVKARCY